MDFQLHDKAAVTKGFVSQQSLFVFISRDDRFMDYITLAETAEKWGISNRRVQTLCSEGRIPGATRLGNMWVIPIGAEKPVDAHIKAVFWRFF